MSPLPGLLAAITIDEEKPMDGMRLGQEISSSTGIDQGQGVQSLRHPIHLYIHPVIHLIHPPINPAI